MKSLSPKQKLFIDEYLIDLNASAAARRAGYSPKTAFRSGQENLQKPAIRSAIKVRMDARAKRTEISQDRVLKEYARLAFLDPRQFFDEDGNLIAIRDLTEDVAAALAGLDVKDLGEDGKQYKIRFTDKLGALQALGRHLGMFEKDNTQRGKVDEEARQVFMTDLFAAIGAATGRGLPKPRGDREK